MTAQHKDIETPQRHNIKGFEEAADNTVQTKNSQGNVEWVDLDTLGGNPLDHAQRHLPQTGADKLPTVEPQTLGEANDVGTSDDFVRGDHVHAHGEQSLGNMHEIATDVKNGFMSKENKSKLDTVEANAKDDQTDVEIKIAYEANANTNEYSDAEKIKLGTVEANAKDDQTAVEIKVAYESNADTNEYSDAEKIKLAGLGGADALPAPIAGVITLADNTNYTLPGPTNIGTDRILFGINSSIRGYNPQQDIITYTGTGNMFTSINNNFILDHLGVSCANGTMIQATNIDYTINPSIDPFQGRDKRFSINNCNLVGGANGLGSELGFLEGFATCNFNANLIVNWDAGFQLSNCLSFEGLNNKSVLWNDQPSTMITLRSNNWSGQTGGVGSYIPTGINAFNFNGNTLHPRTSGYAALIEVSSSTALGNIAGNIFITTGITTGGIFNPASVGFNELPTYNIQANTGIPDNTPTIQASIDRLQSYVTTINTTGVLEKINFGNTVQTTSNLLISNRLLVTNVAGFIVDEIVTGGTSGFTGKIESIDAVNNYIYIKYVVDGLGVNQYFTVGETITGGTSLTATTYNGVDGSFKYYGAKEISIRFIATITLEKVNNGRETFEIVPVKNGVALDDLSTVTYLEGNRPRDGVAQAILPFSNGDILELHIRNIQGIDGCECQGLVFNISGR